LLGLAPKNKTAETQVETNLGGFNFLRHSLEVMRLKKFDGHLS